MLDEDRSVKIDFFQFGNYVCHLSKGRIKAIDGGLFEANLDIEQQSDIYQLTKNEIAVIRNTEHGFLYTIEYAGEKFEKQNIINDYFASCLTMNHNNTLFIGSFNEGIIDVPHEKLQNLAQKTLQLALLHLTIMKSTFLTSEKEYLNMTPLKLKYKTQVKILRLFCI